MLLVEWASDMVPNGRSEKNQCSVGRPLTPTIISCLASLSTAAASVNRTINMVVSCHMPRCGARIETASSQPAHFLPSSVVCIAS